MITGLGLRIRVAFSQVEMKHFLMALIKQFDAAWKPQVLSRYVSSFFGCWGDLYSSYLSMDASDGCGSILRLHGNRISPSIDDGFMEFLLCRQYNMEIGCVQIFQTCPFIRFQLPGQLLCFLKISSIFSKVSEQSLPTASKSSRISWSQPVFVRRWSRLI